MQNSKKLKPNWFLIIFYILLFGIIIGNAIINHENRIMFEHMWIGLYALAGLMAFVSWLNTRDLYSLNFMIFCMLCLVFFGGYLENKILKLLCSLLLLMVLIIHFILLAKGRNQWQARKILELAAKPVNDKTNGFTGRPYPAGKIKFTKKQIKDFAKFIKKNMIAFPHVQQNSVSIILIDFDYRLMLPFVVDYSKRTYVLFDYSGKVFVNIAKMDYKKYKDQLTFDQLCESMGNIFITFFNLYQQNRGKEIMNRISGKNE